jgi:uncharacterized membrane protein
MNSQKLDLNTPNMLGGICGIFLVIGPLLFSSDPILIAGLILILVAFHQYSKILNNPSIFQYGLIWSIASIIIAVLFIFFEGIAASIFAGIVASIENGDSILGMLGILGVLLFLSIYGANIFAAVNLKKALKELSITLNQNLFDMSGKFIFWGTLLSIILIGLLGIFIGNILLTIAFFTAPKEIQLNNAEETSAM